MELEEIKAGMDELTSGMDLEVEHMKADTFLVELAKSLASRIGGETEKQVSAILEQYDNVGKWYS